MVGFLCSESAAPTPLLSSSGLRNATLRASTSLQIAMALSLAVHVRLSSTDAHLAIATFLSIPRIELSLHFDPSEVSDCGVDNNAHLDGTNLRQTVTADHQVPPSLTDQGVGCRALDVLPPEARRWQRVLVSHERAVVHVLHSEGAVVSQDHAEEMAVGQDRVDGERGVPLLALADVEG